MFDQKRRHNKTLASPHEQREYHVLQLETKESTETQSIGAAEPLCSPAVRMLVLWGGDARDGPDAPDHAEPGDEP